MVDWIMAPLPPMPVRPQQAESPPLPPYRVTVMDVTIGGTVNVCAPPV
jgi:hypothetical protein